MYGHCLPPSCLAINEDRHRGGSWANFSWPCLSYTRMWLFVQTLVSHVPSLWLATVIKIGCGIMLMVSVLVAEGDDGEVERHDRKCCVQQCLSPHPLFALQEWWSTAAAGATGAAAGAGATGAGTAAGAGAILNQPHLHRHHSLHHPRRAGTMSKAVA
eukprot:scaffold280711_cov18-Tisochrysis_lutea.AAC.1